MNKTNRFSFILKSSTIEGAGVGVFALHDIAIGTHMELFLTDFEEEIVSIESVPTDWVQSKKSVIYDYTPLREYTSILRMKLRNDTARRTRQ